MLFNKTPEQILAVVKKALIKETITDKETLNDILELKSEIEKVEAFLKANKPRLSPEQEKHIEKMLNSLKMDVRKAEAEIERSKKALNEATQHAHNLINSLVTEAGRR